MKRVKCLAQSPGLVSPRAQARASGQERLHSPFCWVPSFSRSVAEFLEGGEVERAPHMPVGSEQRAHKNQ